MAELEDIFLQNTAVAAALLEDEAAQPLREKLLAALAANGRQSQRRVRGAEEKADAEEEHAEESAETNADAGKIAEAQMREYGGGEAEGRSAQTLLEEMSAQEKTADSGDSDGTRAARSAPSSAERNRAYTDGTEGTRETQQTRVSDNSATAREAGDMPEASAAGSMPERAEIRAQWETAPGAARLLLEALGDEGLSSAETALAARLVRARQGADAATEVTRQEENLPAQVLNAAADRPGQEENSGEAGERGAFAAPYAASDGSDPRAEAETGEALAESGWGRAQAPGAGAQTGKSGGSEEKSGAWALWENRSTEISGRDRMAEISRFFERDARRYGQ